VEGLSRSSSIDPYQQVFGEIAYDEGDAMNPAPSILLLLAFFVIPYPAFASSTLKFGTDDTINKIQDLPGTNYTLCYHYHINYFIAGVYLANDGYVLTEKPDNKKQTFFTDASTKYLPLTKEKINELQQTGLLPRPLPPYSIPTFEYFDGFSLWWILLFTIVVLFVRSRIRLLWNRYTAPDP
jgi:hypothetical protein